MKDIIDLIARILLSGLFLLAAARYSLYFSNTIEDMVAHGIARPALWLYASLFCMILGGILVLIGYRAKFGATLLLLFMIPSTLIFHTELTNELQQTMFVKNLAIIGGLMTIYVNGSGKYSVRKLLASTRS